MIKNKFLAFLTLAFYCQTYSQNIWSLRSCIEYGLANNKNTIISANKKKAADAKAKELLSAYLPQISITTTLDKNLKLQQSVIPAGIFGDQETRIAFGQKYQSAGTAQLDQVIFDYALLTGLKANKYNKQQAEIGLAQSREAIIYNISTAYFQISVYREMLDLLQANKETYSRQIDIYKLQVAKGIALQKDLDKVTVENNNNATQIRVAESNLQLAENELKFEMGYPFESPLEVDSVTEASVPQVLNTNTAKQYSPASKTEYHLSEVKIKLLEIDQDRIRSEGLPKLTAYFRYGAVGFGDEIKGVYNPLSEFSAAGLKLSIPVLDFYRRGAQYAQAETLKINAQEQLKLDEGRYRVDFENASTQLTKADANLDNDKRNVVLAESVLKTTDFQFQKGVTTLIDWLNTQNALKEAQNSYVNSLYNFYLAKIDLEKAAGTLNQFYNSL